MPALLELQRSMRAQLLHDAARDTLDEERLAIYRHTMLSALVNALRLSYPAVQKLVGADFFEATAREFIQTHAPGSAYLNDYGAGFAEFLAQFESAAGIRYLPDVARLEWAVNRALHAPDVDALQASALAHVAEDQLSGVSFSFHPSISLLQLHFPADVIWRAVLEQNEQAMAAVHLNNAAVWLLIERDQHGVQVRRLSQSAWQFTLILSQGRPLFEAFGDADEDQQAAISTLLADHLACGRFTDFSVGDLRS